MKTKLSICLITGFLCAFGGSSLSAKDLNRNINFKDWSASIDPAGGLNNITVKNTELIRYGLYLLAMPIDENSGQAERIMDFIDENLALKDTVTKRGNDGEDEVIQTRGKISSKSAELIAYTKTIRVNAAGKINFKYELEFLSDNKWKTMFCPATALSRALTDAPYTEALYSGEKTSSKFADKFIQGSVKTLKIESAVGPVEFSASADCCWSVEDTRSYQGGDTIIIYVRPGWFKKGMLIEKGRKETAEFSIQLPGAAGNASNAAAPAAVAQKPQDSGGPGTVIPTMDQYKLAGNPVNPLFFNELSKKRWWNNDWEYRIPLVVSETIGKNRVAALVIITNNFPEKVSPESIRIVTAGCVELPSQAEVMDRDSNTFKTTFQTDLAAGENLPLFVYFGNKKAKETSNDDVILKIRENDDSHTIYNSRILVEFLKQPLVNGTLVRKLELFNSNGRNQILNFMDANPGCGGSFAFSAQLPDLKIKEVISRLLSKQIVYTNADVILTFTIYNDSNCIYYHFKNNKTENISFSTGFLPHGDLNDDALCYESKDGIRELPINGIGYNRQRFELSKYLKEGWICLADKNGDALGLIGDNKALSAVQHEIAHYATQSEIGKTFKGAVIAVHGGYQAVRGIYIEWKNPPEAALGTVQARSQVKAPEVPVIGQDFASVLYGISLDNYPLNEKNMDILCDKIINQVIAKESNIVMIEDKPRVDEVSWQSDILRNNPPGNTFLKKMIDTAHNKGVGVIVSGQFYHMNEWNKKNYEKMRINLPQNGTQWGCPVGDKEFYVKVNKELAGLGPDAVYLLDEYAVSGEGKDYREGFEKKYGLKFPAKFEYKDLNKPENYNQVFYSIEVINNLVKAISEGIKSVKPDCVIYHSSSPANNLRALGGGYHDLEAQADDLTFAATDPYTTDINSIKYTLKLCRGATGNNRPVHTWVGWSTYDEGMNDPDFFRKETYLHILAGANLFTWCGASMSDQHLPATATAMKKVLRLLDYTGLGNLVTVSNPLKFAAVFRDRDAFFDSIKNGECRTKYALTDYDKRVEKAVLLKNIPTDMLCSKYFTPDNLRQYPVVIIPGAKAMADKYANVLAGYVEGGGCLIVQGETVNNSVLADLCKVKVLRKNANAMVNSKGIGGILAGKSANMVDEIMAVENRGGEVLLADAGNRPLIILSQSGKGKVIYTALVNEFPFLEDIIKSLAGKIPVEISAKVYSNIFQSGDIYILGIYNPSYKETFEDDIVLNLPIKESDKVISVMEGRAIPMVKGAFKVQVPPDGVYYYVIGPETALPLIPVNKEKMDAELPYSTASGMQFLYQKEVRKAESAAARPPKDPKFLYIGIYNGGNGDKLSGWQGIKDALRDYEKYIKTDFIPDLNPATIAYYNVIVVPTISMGSLPESLNKDWIECLRSYVENGGGVLLMHNSIGPRGAVSLPVFPETGRILGNSPFKNLKIIARHPLIQSEALKARCGGDVANPGLDVIFRKAEIKEGDVFNYAYVDHVEIEPGADGEVLARSLNAENQIYKPVFAVGKLGKGKVALAGMPIGIAHKPGTEWDAEEKAPTGGELALLINSIFWLAGK